jgi:hypothetical protein
MVLDATVGGASANSYLTVADADALAAADMGPEADRWAEAGTTVASREIALQRATREIDDYVRPGFPRHSATQALRFPRANADVDSDGDPFIPADIRHACYLQAAFILSNAAAIDRASARHARNQAQYSEPGTSGTEGQDSSSSWSLRALQALSAYAKASRTASGGMTSTRVASGFAG